MKYIISSDLAELEAINEKIHQQMKETIPDYNADKWSDIFKHPKEDLYMLPIKDSDPRNPLTALEKEEKTKCVESIAKDWKEIKNGVSILQKVDSKINVL